MPDLESILRRRGDTWTEYETAAVFEWIYKHELDELVKLAFRRLFGFVGPREGLFVEAERVAETKTADAYRFRHTYDPSRYRFYDLATPSTGHDAFRNWLHGNVVRAAVTRGRILRKQAPLVAIPPEGFALNQPVAQPIETAPVSDEDALSWDSHVAPILDRLTALHQETLRLCRHVVNLAPGDMRRMQAYEHAARTSTKPCTANAMKTRFCRAMQELKRLWGTIAGEGQSEGAGL